MIFSKEEMIFKQMTHNSDEPFPIVIDKLNCFPFNSYARSYHVCTNIWNPVDEEILVCTREIDNPRGNYAVFIKHSTFVVGHVPLRLSKPFSNFLSLPGSTIICTSLDKQ